jgi:dipeptidyl-peptidase-4
VADAGRFEEGRHRRRAFRSREDAARARARSAASTGIVAYDWAPDGKSILVPLDGELYLADAGRQGTNGCRRRRAQAQRGDQPRGRLRQLCPGPESGGRCNLAPARRAPITEDGKGTVHWGEAEFVAQEEMDRFTGYWWSPGDRYIAVERFDEAPVGIVTRAAIGAEGTSIFQQRYPKAGTPNVLVELYVMDPAGANKVKVDLGKETDIYLTRVDWAPDGSALYVQRMNRDQTVLDMLKVDPATGKSSVLFSEKSGPKSWVNLSDALPRRSATAA